MGVEETEGKELVLWPRNRRGSRDAEESNSRVRHWVPLTASLANMGGQRQGTVVREAWGLECPTMVCCEQNPL